MNNSTLAIIILFLVIISASSISQIYSNLISILKERYYVLIDKIKSSKGLSIIFNESDEIINSIKENNQLHGQKLSEIKDLQYAVVLTIIQNHNKKLFWYNIGTNFDSCQSLNFLLNKTNPTIGFYHFKTPKSKRYIKYGDLNHYCDEYCNHPVKINHNNIKYLESTLESLNYISFLEKSNMKYTLDNLNITETGIVYINISIQI